MNITKENTDKLNAVLTIKVEKEDYTEKVDTVIKDYRKKARIDGFRPGKVPEGLIKKMYGKAILIDEVNKIISESLTSYIREEKLNILGEPMPSKDQPKIANFDNDTEFEFTFDIGLAPEVEVKLSKKDKVVFYGIKVDNKMLDMHIENYTKRFGEFVDKDNAEENDLLKGTFTELNEENNPAEEGVRTEDATISLEAMKDKESKDLFIGKKVGDKVNFDLAKAYPSDTELSALLKIDKDRVNEISNIFEFEIQNVQKFENAKVDQDFFDKAFGEGNVNSEDEFKEKITEEIKVNLVKESDYRFIFDLKENLVTKFNPELPVEFLKRWLLESNEGKLTEEQIEKEFEAFEKDLRWQLIKDQIIKEQEFKVEEDEILNTAKQLTLMQFQQYGLSYLPDEQLENYAKEILKKPEEARKIVDKILEDKTVAYIKESIKLDNKEISSEDFEKLWKEETKKKAK